LYHQSHTSVGVSPETFLLLLHILVALPGVLLSTSNLSLTLLGVRKFHPQLVGSFQVLLLVVVSNLSYYLLHPSAARLDLPPHWRVHNAFHVFCVLPCLPNSELDNVPQFAFFLAEGEEMELVPDKMLRGRPTAGKQKYLFTFRGLDPEFNHWMSESQFNKNK
jgi:hypothetical protein